MLRPPKVDKKYDLYIERSVPEDFFFTAFGQSFWEYYDLWILKIVIGKSVSYNSQCVFPLFSVHLGLGRMFALQVHIHAV